MEYKFKNLVFEGGGVKGIAYAGALEELDIMGILMGVKRVAGTSAGAITATLLSVGYTPKEISIIVGGTDFKKFEDNTFLFVRDIIRLFKKFGWNKGEVFKKWLGDLIEKKTGSPDFTFSEMYKANDKYKDLYIVVSNLTKQRADVLSYETSPNMSIRDAVRMSMSIPLFFESTSNIDGDVIVDGGVVMNYPINVFDNIRYVYNIENCLKIDSSNDYAFNYETLGFRVDSIKKVDYLNPNWPEEPYYTKGIKSFMGALLSFMMDMANKSHLTRNDWNRTIFIDSGDIKTTEFSLSKSKVGFLVNNGKSATLDYFNWKNSDEKWSKFPL